MLVSLVLLLRIVANPLTNVFQKLLTQRGVTPQWVILVTFTMLTLLCAPLMPFHHWQIRPGFWSNILICGVLAIAGNLALIEAIRESDLSVLGPINAYKSVVSLVPAFFLLHERPRLWQLVGIGLILIGSFFVVEDKKDDDKDDDRQKRPPLSGLWRDRGVRYRMLGLVLSATEAVFLKRATNASDPLTTLIFWTVLGSIGAMLYLLIVSNKQQTREAIGLLRKQPGVLALLGLTTGFMQFCTLLTFKSFAVGPALALFQTSAIVTVILGNQIFHEKHLWRRLAGSAIMVVGAVQIVMTHTKGGT